MRLLKRFLAVLSGLALPVTLALAQPLPGSPISVATAPGASDFPPSAALVAPNLNAAVAALGATPVEPSTHLMLDVPDIAAAGAVNVTASSAIPGTTRLVLLRQWPTALADSAGAAGSRSRGSAVAATRPTPPSVVPAALPPPAPPTVFIAAKVIEPLQPATISARVDFSRREIYYLLAYAQGRWYSVSREVKLAVAEPATP